MYIECTHHNFPEKLYFYRFENYNNCIDRLSDREIVIDYRQTCAQIPLAERSRRGSAPPRLLGFAGSCTAGGMDCLSVVSVVCCQIEVTASGDQSSSGAPSSVVCLSVIMKHGKRGGPGTLGGCCAMRKRNRHS